MKIITANSAGFCFGVKRAIKIALDAAVAGSIYSLGPLIHNPQEVERLAKLGVFQADSLDDLQGSSVIIRSHGVPPQVVEALQAKGCHIVDATCPFVKKAQSIAEKLQAETGCVVVVGDRNHPEVIGILGFLGENAMVLHSLEEAKKKEFPARVGVMSQTTQTMERFREIVDYIKTRVEEVVVYNTICRATAERQKEAAALAKQVDFMLVIGGKNSANTKKLADIARENGAETYTVETVDEIINIKNIIKKSNFLRNSQLESPLVPQPRNGSLRRLRKK